MLFGRQPHFCFCIGLCGGGASLVLPISFMWNMTNMTFNFLCSSVLAAVCCHGWRLSSAGCSGLLCRATLSRFPRFAYRRQLIC